MHLDVPYNMFMMLKLFSALVATPFWDRFWKLVWLVLDSTFVARGNKQVTKMSSIFDATIGNEQIGFEKA